MGDIILAIVLGFAIGVASGLGLCLAFMAVRALVCVIVGKATGRGKQ